MFTLSAQAWYPGYQRFFLVRGGQKYFTLLWHERRFTNTDMTDTGNHTRKTSGTQGISWYFIVWISNLLLGLKKILEFWLALGKIVARKVCLSNGQVFLCFLITYFQTIVCPLGKCEWKVACPEQCYWTFFEPLLCTCTGNRLHPNFLLGWKQLWIYLSEN